MAKKKLRRNDANYCRQRGWTVGTVLTLERGSIETGGWYTGRQHTQRCRITAIGEEAILVRRAYSDGKEQSEQKWVRRLINQLVLESSPKEPPCSPTPN